MPHPKDTPLVNWTLSWLKLEVAILLDTPGYLMMHDHEKRAAGYPVTSAEMIELIEGRRRGDAILADPSLIDN